MATRGPDASFPGKGKTRSDEQTEIQRLKRQLAEQEPAVCKGDPAKWVDYEVRDGGRMRVVYQPATGNVITAFPGNAPIPV